jgi:hypothetical protein
MDVTIFRNCERNNSHCLKFFVSVRATGRNERIFGNHSDRNQSIIDLTEKTHSVITLIAVFEKGRRKRNLSAFIRN